MIVFDNMITDKIIDNQLKPVVTELFICGRKLSSSLVSIAH